MSDMLETSSGLESSTPDISRYRAWSEIPAEGNLFLANLCQPTTKLLISWMLFWSSSEKSLEKTVRALVRMKESSSKGFLTETGTR